MRFLNTETYKLTDDDDPEFRRKSSDYAILSHVWIKPGGDPEGEREITYQTLNPADLLYPSPETPQLRKIRGALKKIRGACAKARQEDPPLDWLWIDTCCINKTNAVEQAASINSMFEWYAKATVCYGYLRDVKSRGEGWQMFKRHDQHDKESEWFERGWTLQELLSPGNMKFYDCNWDLIGTKEGLASDLERVTGIDKGYLTGKSNIQEASVATRMSWMAGRTTGMIEDIAYSMLGIFGINMSPQYGEGKKAFMRLQRTLLESSSDESIFAWTVPANKELACFRQSGRPPVFAEQYWGMLAPSPDCFKDSKDVVVIKDMIVPRLNGGCRWTQEGVQFDMTMRSGTEATNWFGLPRKKIDLPMNCWRDNTDGTPPTIVLRLIRTNNSYKREQCYKLDVKKNAKPSTNHILGVDQGLTRPLTIAHSFFN